MFAMGENHTTAVVEIKSDAAGPLLGRHRRKPRIGELGLGRPNSADGPLTRRSGIAGTWVGTSHCRRAGAHAHIELRRNGIEVHRSIFLGGYHAHTSSAGTADNR